MLQIITAISIITALFCAAGWYREWIASLTLSCYILKHFGIPKNTDLDECKNEVAKQLVYNNVVMKFFEKR